MIQSKLSISGNKFIDQSGRHILLHGISLINKNPGDGYRVDTGPEFYASLVNWGLNVIRLGVIWDGLEPEPGVFDEDYLQQLDQQIAYAKQHDIYVFLDMHQDLYSVLFSDGAPEWATLTDGAPHVDLGGVWSDAYFTSPAVQTALDNFWSNTPARDGVGIQDHYAQAWTHLAKRYAHEPAIIGYEIMNEPFPGRKAVEAQAMMFAKGAELFTALGLPLGEYQSADSASHPSPVESLGEQWLTEKGRSEILQLLRDLDIYMQIIDVTQPLYADFEKTYLKVMYQRVANAIREVDSKTLLFLETTMGSNMGVYSAIEPIIVNKVRDPAQVYAPHGYDLVVDTPDIAAASPERVQLIFQRHGETAMRLGMPMLVGEWGAYGRHPGTLPAAWHVVHQFESLLCSETYWAYESGIEYFPCFQAVQRPYPERIAGVLQSYHYDPVSHIFSCTWREDGRISAPNRIYLPDWFAYLQSNIHIDPVGLGYQIEATSPCSKNHVLLIQPVGHITTRTLTIYGRP